MPDIRRELADEIEVTALPGRALIGFLAESEGDWLVVCVDGERRGLHHVSKILDR